MHTLVVAHEYTWPDTSGPRLRLFTSHGPCRTARADLLRKQLVGGGHERYLDVSKHNVVESRIVALAQAAVDAGAVTGL